jgi:hypothetical protein
MLEQKALRALLDQLDQRVPLRQFLVRRVQQDRLVLKATLVLLAHRDLMSRDQLDLKVLLVLLVQLVPKVKEARQAL